MSSGDDFDLSDSSSSDDSDLDELLQDDDLEATMLLLAVKDLEDRAKLLNRRRGSVFGRNHIQRNRLLGHEQLMEDYFAEVPTYPAHLFRRRYRMRRSLFVRIIKDCELHSNYFKQRRNAAGVMGFSAFQKISAAMRVIAYGIHADYTDEYLRIGEDTTTQSVRRFARMIIKLYGPTYLRAPNEDDTKQLMEINEKRGWPGMLGSIDCMHWTWKNCPKAWHGQYCGKSKDATIVLEAVASQDLWIWHYFFGLPGTLNDINVLQRSPLFAKLANGEAPTCNYKVMNNEYTMGYYLADGIYPDWATFVKSVKDPQDRIEAEFAKAQEAARKDIERAFGVLQARFAIPLLKMLLRRYYRPYTSTSSSVKTRQASERTEPASNRAHARVWQGSSRSSRRVRSEQRQQAREQAGQEIEQATSRRQDDTAQGGAGSVGLYNMHDQPKLASACVLAHMLAHHYQVLTNC
nr:uncharacterized protein LOC127328352 [Lolium perenne]